MAYHKSALKRARQNEDRRLRNKAVKTSVKNIVKEVRKEAGMKKLDAAKSKIDKAAKKGVLHNKTASRKISRLSNLINAISA